jgi:hypothetical protein
LDIRRYRSAGYQAPCGANFFFSVDISFISLLEYKILAIEGDARGKIVECRNDTSALIDLLPYKKGFARILHRRHSFPTWFKT